MANKIWLCSDWHFGHNRQFIYKPRGFETIEEMNEAIIARHNELVDNDDDVYVLGDLTLGELEPGLECIKRMNGRLHIVFGNHDTTRRQEAYKQLPNVVECAWAIMLNYKKYHFYLTHFPSMTGNLENESLKKMTCNISGHTHSKQKFYEDRPYMPCVCMDARDCKPVLIDEMLQEMKDKVRECVAAAEPERPEELDETTAEPAAANGLVRACINCVKYSYCYNHTFVNECGCSVFEPIIFYDYTKYNGC